MMCIWEFEISSDCLKGTGEKLESIKIKMGSVKGRRSSTKQARGFKSLISCWHIMANNDFSNRNSTEGFR